MLVWFTLLADVSTEVNRTVYRYKMQGSTFIGSDFSDISNFVFKVNHFFMEEKGIPSEKAKIDRKQLDDVKNCSF